MDPLERSLAVVRVEQQPVRQLLDPIREAVERAVQPGPHVVGDAELEDLLVA